jgi:carbamoyltransferase
MKILGIASQGHDASVTVVDDTHILFAGHAERYSRVKNDGDINQALLDDALRDGDPDLIVWYERPLVKRLRQLHARQYHELPTPLPHQQLAEFELSQLPLKYVSHHRAAIHAPPFWSSTQLVNLIHCRCGRDEEIGSLAGGGNATLIVWDCSTPL